MANLKQRLEKLENTNEDRAGGVMLVYYSDGEPFESKFKNISITRGKKECASDFEARVIKTFTPIATMTQSSNCISRINIEFV